MSVDIENWSPLETLEEVFRKLVSENAVTGRDERAAGFIPILLREAVVASHKVLGHHREENAYALEAFKLYQMLPCITSVWADGSSSGEFVKTRTLLWAVMIKGVRIEGARDDLAKMRAKHLKNFLTKTDTLSHPEINALRETARESFKNMSSYHAKELLKTFQELTGPFGPQPLQALFTALVKTLDEDTQIELFRSVKV